jgi:hypothetical protein
LPMIGLIQYISDARLRPVAARSIVGSASILLATHSSSQCRWPCALWLKIPRTNTTPSQQRLAATPIVPRIAKRRNTSPDAPGSGSPAHEVQPQIPGVHTAVPAITAPALIASAIAGLFKPLGFLAKSTCSSMSYTYSAGSSAVNDEQHGFSVAWKFMISVRIPSGSYILNWYLPSRPILGA